MADKKLGRCIIISGSPDADVSFIKSQIKPDDYVICADRGYSYAQQCFLNPDLVIGDFDSFNGTVDDNVEIISLKVHKDYTDTMHCAKVALERGYRNIIILGALGGRFDHSFANLSILKYLSEKGATSKILTENESIEYKPKGEYEYLSLNGYTFSVFPFGCNEIEVTYKGQVEYPANFLKVSSSDTITISNIFRSDNVIIAIEKGSALIIVDRVL